MKLRNRTIGRMLLLLVLALGVFGGGLQEEAAAGATVQVVKFSTPVAPDHPNNIAALKFAEIVNKERGGQAEGGGVPGQPARERQGRDRERHDGQRAHVHGGHV